MADEIGIAFSKTGGSASALGVQFEKVASWIAIISSKTRESAESIGHSINTLLTRMANMKASGFDEEDGTQINDVAKALATVDIALVDSQGQFRDFGKVMDEIGSKWNSLDSRSQAYIATTVAGTRQQSRFLNLMNAYSDSVGLYEEALDSAGTTQSKFNIYLESNRATLDKLKSTSQGLWLNFWDNDGLMNIVEGFTDFIQTLDNLVQKFGSLGAILSVVIPMLAVRFVFAVKSAYIELIKMQGGFAGAGITTFSSQLKLAASQALGLSIATDQATVSTAKLNLATIGATAGISLLVAGLFTLVNRANNAKQEMDELVETFKRQQQSHQSMDKLVESYEELSKQTNLTTEEQQDLLEVKQKITDLIPQAKSVIDDENLSLEEQLRLLKNLNEQELERARNEAGRVVADYSSSYEQSQSAIENATRTIAKHQAIIDELNIKQANGLDLTKEESIAYKNSSDIISAQSKVLEIHQARIDAVDNARAILSGTTKENIENTQKEAQVVEDSTSIIQSHKQLLEDSTKSYEDVTDKLINYNKILHELNSSEGLSGSTKDEIIRKHQELAPYIDNEKQLRQELIRIIGEEEKAQSKAYKEMIMYSETFFNAKLKGNAELVDKLGKYYSADLENAKNLAHAKEMVESKLISKLSEKWAGYYRALVAGDKNTEHGLAMAAMRGDKEANALLQRYKEIEDAFNGIAESFVSEIDFKGINLSGINDKKEKDKYSALADATLKYRNAIEEVNHQLSILKSKQNLETDDLNKITLLQKQNELLKQQQVNYHNLANAQRQERDSLVQSLSKQGFKFAGEGDNKIITNLENIKGKSKEVEEQFKKFIDLQTKEIPSASQQWWGLEDSIKSVIVEMEKLEVGNLFKTSTKGIESLNKEFEMLDFRLNLLDENETGQKFDLMSQKIQKAEFQVRFLSDELQRLKAVGFEGSIEAVEEYNKQLEDLEKKHMDAQLFLKSLTDSYDSDYKKIMSEREKIADDTINVIKKAYQKQRELVINSLNQELRAEENAHKRRIERLDEQLNKYEEIIKAQLDSIDRQEDEDSFNKDLSKAQEERAEIVRQISVLSMDDSLEARARVSELNKQLAEQDERIEEMKHNRTIDLRKQNLNDQLNAYKKDIEEKKNAEDAKYERIKLRIEQEIQLEEWKYDKLINDEQYYADLRQEIIDGNLENVQESLQGFLDEFDNYNKRTVQGIESSWQSLLNMIREIELAQDGLGKMPSGGKGSSGISYGGSGGSSSRGLNLGKGAATGDDARKNDEKLKNDPKFLESELRRTQEVINDRKKAGLDTSLQEDYLKKIITGSYAEGGKITHTGLAMVHGSANKPEYVFNYDQFKDLAKFVANYQPKITTPKIPEISRAVEIRFDNLINIEGNATKDTIPALNKAGNNILENLQKQLIKNGVQRGVKL